MKYSEARDVYKNKWILFQAVSAYSENGKRIVTDLAVLKSYEKGNDALKDYTNYHKADKQKEYYNSRNFRNRGKSLGRSKGKWLI